MGTYDYSPVYWYSTSSTTTEGDGIDMSTAYSWYWLAQFAENKLKEKKQKDVTQEEFDDIF